MSTIQAEGPNMDEKEKQTSSLQKEAEEEIDVNLDDPQVQEAAKKIQSVFRVKRFGDKKNEAANK